MQLRRFYQSRVEPSLKIDAILEQPTLGQLVSLTMKHDKEGVCGISAQEVPFFAQCRHEYQLVFTKVGQICFIALYKKNDPQLVSPSKAKLTFHAVPRQLFWTCTRKSSCSRR